MKSMRGSTEMSISPLKYIELDSARGGDSFPGQPGKIWELEVWRLCERKYIINRNILRRNKGLCSS
jgi:hypothetical protein